MWRKVLRVVLLVLLYLLLLAGLTACVMARWMTANWAHLSMEELVYQLTNSIQGTNSEIVMSGVAAFDTHGDCSRYEQ